MVRRRHQEPRSTVAQYALGKQLQQSVKRLFEYLEIDDKEVKDLHRIFYSEIIELGPEISLILVLPPTDIVCSVNETLMSINLNRSNLLLVPLQAW